MKHKFMLNSLVKLGLTVTQPRSDNTNFFRVQRGIQVLSWYSQGEDAICVHCTVVNDGRDSQTDYFPGYFARTVKSAVEHLKKPLHPGAE